MTDAEVLAKVQASARIVLHEPADEKGDDAISARVALAMVEQVPWFDEAIAAHRRMAEDATDPGDELVHIAAAHAFALVRYHILSALRAAVGE